MRYAIQYVSVSGNGNACIADQQAPFQFDVALVDQLCRFNSILNRENS